MDRLGRSSPGVFPMKLKNAHVGDKIKYYYKKQEKVSAISITYDHTEAVSVIELFGMFGVELFLTVEEKDIIELYTPQTHPELFL